VSQTLWYERGPLPYCAHRHFPETKLADLRRQRAESIEKSSQVVIQDRQGNKGGLSHLPWDSRLLQISAGRIDFLPDQDPAELIPQLLKEAEKEGINHLSIRAEASQISLIQALEKQGFIVVDALVTFGRTTSHHVTESAHSFTIRFAEPRDKEVISELGGRAFRVDRFHNDPEIAPSKADEIYREWSRNSVEGRAADAVVIAEDSRRLLGFVTCRLITDTLEPLGSPVGVIPLVATDEQHRRAGVARAMTLRAINWFHEQGAEICEVGTQLANIPACRLYESCGFRIVSSNVSLRHFRQ
jgi:GNAT superfamily N-acetyltransferase